MKNIASNLSGSAVLLTVGILLLFAGTSDAGIPGLTGTSFHLTAKRGYISTPDGFSLFAWGYANGTGPMQYTGPTLIVNEGDTITVTLSNELRMNTSVVFPGQIGVIATGGASGLLTEEAVPGGTATYRFKAVAPGTYLYHSGTRPELQVEMGLVGALIVRPAGFDPAFPTVYGDSSSRYDRENLFLLTEMDPRIHTMVDNHGVEALEETDLLSNYYANYWFINGRAAVDTLQPAGAGWLPNQPYNCLPMMHPGERSLIRMIGGGRDQHPFHPHGNNQQIIGIDGRELQSPGGVGADLATMVYTLPSSPGQTMDVIWTWTGEKLGWDVYGHDVGDALEPREYAPDHGKRFPAVLPELQDLAFGSFWSGNPFLGQTGYVPPGEGGFNPWGAYVLIWHCHSEREIMNNGVFPGGLITFNIILPWSVPLDD